MIFSFNEERERSRRKRLEGYLASIQCALCMTGNLICNYFKFPPTNFHIVQSRKLYAGDGRWWDLKYKKSSVKKTEKTSFPLFDLDFFFIWPGDYVYRATFQLFNLQFQGWRKERDREEMETAKEIKEEVSFPLEFSVIFFHSHPVLPLSG